MDEILKNNYPRMRFITWLNENLSMVELSIRQFITWQYLLPFNKNECITLIWRRQNIYKIIVLNTWEIVISIPNHFLSFQNAAFIYIQERILQKKDYFIKYNARQLLFQTENIFKDYYSFHTYRVSIQNTG